mmetsp:Transcript_62492/g.118152  ORF Transcript_62492/g.118152 Transcript_62492/m.118152 type:complete len:351 (-) Transcript_62492:1127-2179(-)
MLGNLPLFGCKNTGRQAGIFPLCRCCNSCCQALLGSCRMSKCLHVLCQDLHPLGDVLLLLTLSVLQQLLPPLQCRLHLLHREKVLLHLLPVYLSALLCALLLRPASLNVRQGNIMSRISPTTQPCRPLLYLLQRRCQLAPLSLLLGLALILRLPHLILGSHRVGKSHMRFRLHTMNCICHLLGLVRGLRRRILQLSITTVCLTGDILQMSLTLIRLRGKTGKTGAEVGCQLLVYFASPCLQLTMTVLQLVLLLLQHEHNTSPVCILRIQPCLHPSSQAFGLSLGLPSGFTLHFLIALSHILHQRSGHLFTLLFPFNCHMLYPFHSLISCLPYVFHHPNQLSPGACERGIY